MRLRAIELTNVRRFAGRRARLAGIGDGVTVLCEPNETGKSTFFDALHALFFQRYSASRAVIRALQPHAGGAPEVAVEVDLPAGRFRISKRWLTRPQAQVTDAAGRLIAQADEAEAWIAALMGGGLAGPSGILWVRQGLTALEPADVGKESQRERDAGLAARRDLLSSVAGEIDLMTGGRRMDAVLDRVMAALAVLATGTDRPKSGGPWKAAVDEAETHAKEEARLRLQAAALTQHLSRRTEVQRALAQLTDPAEAEARARDLARASAARQTAREHQDKVAQAASALRLAGLAADGAAAEVARLAGLKDRLAAAHLAQAQAEAAATETRVRADDLADRDHAAAAARDAAASATRGLRDRLARTARLRAAGLARDRAEELRGRLTRATDYQAKRDDARARRARIKATGTAIAALEVAQAALDLARARAEAQAVTVEAFPLGPAALAGGRPLPPGPQPVLARVELTLPGFGRLTVDPRIAPTDGTAQADCDAALVACGAETLAAARTAWQAATALDTEIARTVALLAEVAPEGVDALRQAVARAQAEAAEAPEADAPEADTPEADTPEAGDAPLAGADLPETRLAETRLADAAAAEVEAGAAAAAAHGLAVKAGEARVAAEVTRSRADRDLATALTDAGDDLPARIAGAQAALPALTEARTVAGQILAALNAAAPDLAAAEARLTRAQTVADQATRAIGEAREELASLNATIAALADEGIEERLAALTDARSEAETRAARYAAEVRALTRLRRALDEARTQARDAYFGPVLRELQPLLTLIHPGAALTIDDATLLPATLTRAGQPEALDILSGGTREQVAILTRLAFARLFATAGRPVPVILDDALVHSDDDRIEAMFDALHHAARDQQILVLTCRQRAFARLGGERARIVVEET